MPKHLPIVPRKRRIAGTKEPWRYYVHMPVDLWEVGVARDRYFREATPAHEYAKSLTRLRQSPASALMKRSAPFLSWLDRKVSEHGEDGARNAFKLLEEQTVHTSKTVQQCVDEHLAALELKGARRATINSAKSRLNSFAQHCHGKTIGSVTDLDVQNWLAKAKSDASKAQCFFLAAALFNRLVRREEIGKSPLRKMDVPKVHRDNIKFMPVGDIEKLLRTAESDPKHRRTIGLIAPILFGGLRVAESARCTAETFKNGMVCLAEKDNKIDARNLEQSAQLAAWLALDGVEFGNNKPARLIAALAKAAKVVIPTNTLRHSCATYLYASGMNIETLARMMCNSPAKLRHHYLNKASKEDAAKFLAIMPEGK